MLRWNNDYNHGAHPEILKALSEINDQHFGGYGFDEWCDAAKSEIKSHFGAQADRADIHFLAGGTQANLTVITAALRPVESVICVEAGHINCHEAGSIEATGHKMLALKSEDGKVHAEALDAEAARFYCDETQEHLTHPKMVYISSPTEWGTLYSLAELKALREVCDKYRMYLFLDGARMGYGLTAPSGDVTLEDIAELADVFYIGGTKCGAMFGEAVVIMNDQLKKSFRFYMKQRGAVLAKGWLMGVQFYTLFKGGKDALYYTECRRAAEYAMELKAAFEAKGVKFAVDSPTNQQFVILHKNQLAALEKKHIVEYMDWVDEDHRMVRFCTAWSSRREDLDVLLADIAAM
ncbi:MAG: aminotransferase class I/II-fold pyridoxal phosphate-dependent enzyme [Firmicutes bacterium]|nr:aminotransferase class I/II-fold pyridoxal phosphate-dependent enzyme [Bacillota bacterium]